MASSGCRHRRNTSRVAGRSELRRRVLRPRREGDSSLRNPGQPQLPGRSSCAAGADGVASLVYGDTFTPPTFVPALARAVGSPRTQLVVGTYVLESSNALVPVTGVPNSVVSASSIPPANATPAMRRYRRAFSTAFPELPPTNAETPVVLAFHNAMEGLLRGIEASNGDLSNSQRRLRAELARVRLNLPSGPALLDRNRRAVRRTYLKRIVGGRGGSERLNSFVSCQESSRRSPDPSSAPAPEPGSQPCRKATPPP